MLLSAIGLQSPLSNLNSNASTATSNLLFFPSPNPHKPHTTTTSTTTTASLKPLVLTANASASSSITTAIYNNASLQNPNTFVTHTLPDDEEEEMVSSASAVASAIRRGSTSPVEFIQKIEKGHNKSKLVLPSPDFQRLCVQQLDLFRRIVDPDAILSVSLRFTFIKFALIVLASLCAY